MTSATTFAYLDHAATTPLDPRVLEAMLPFLKDHYGNASSVHRLGRKARFAIEDSRERIAAHLGVTPGEIVFTSGGTESNNMALKGAIPSAGALVTFQMEHEAVLTQAESIKGRGGNVKILPPNGDGSVNRTQVMESFDREGGVLSCMHINNEVGIVNPVSQLSELVHAKGGILHCDAVQSIGLTDWTSLIQEVDLLTGSGHKFYGPKGVGFLYVRAGIELRGLVEGGSQERKRRGGTENVAGVVGMAKALDLAVAEREQRLAHISSLKGLMMNGIQEVLEQETFILNTPLDPIESAPHIINLAFPPVNGIPIDGEMLILNLDMEGICVSSGSACTSGAIKPSHVLLAMGRNPQTAAAAVRFSFGKDNTEEEIEYTVDRLEKIVTRMRGTVHA